MRIWNSQKTAVHRKHLGWTERSATLLKRDPKTGVSCEYCKIFENRFFIEHLRWLLLTILPKFSKVRWGCLFFDFAPPRAFNFDQKLKQKVAQIFFYYHMTKQFLCCLNWLITCFWFQNMFWENISFFWFWWETSTKRCTSNLDCKTTSFQLTKNICYLKNKKCQWRSTAVLVQQFSHSPPNIG